MSYDIYKQWNKVTFLNYAVGVLYKSQYYQIKCQCMIFIIIILSHSTHRSINYLIDYLVYCTESYLHRCEYSQQISI